MHVVEMIEGDYRRFEQRRAGYAVGKIALRKLFRSNKQVVQRPELIDQAGLAAPAAGY